MSGPKLYSSMIRCWCYHPHLQPRDGQKQSCTNYSASVSVLGLSVASEIESWVCFLCTSENCNTLDFAFCSHPISHKLCPECFDAYVTFKVTGSEKANLIQSNCIMSCPTTGCTHSVDMRVYARHMSAKAYELYLSCFSEFQIITDQKACDVRLKAELAKAAIAPIAAEFSNYVEHIAHELILPRCPIKECRTLFPPDFDGCCALQCGPVVCIVNSR